MEKYNPPINLNFEILNLSNQIEVLLRDFAYLPTVKSKPRLRKQNRIRSIHSSCAIEANSLSLEQVSDVINGKPVLGSRKDILEVKNAIKAYDNIENYDCYSLSDLKKAHGYLTKDILEDPELFRNNEEGVFDGEKCIFIAPPPHMVSELMDQLFSWHNNDKDNISLLIKSCIFHYEFVFIHPFKDGNGRTARLWQNVILGRYNSLFYWLPIENYIEKYQKEYYSAINESNKNGESSAFVTFMLEMILKSLKELKQTLLLQLENEDELILKLLNVMKLNIPVSSNELLNRLNLKSKMNLMQRYINPALSCGYIELEYPNNPKSRKQRYIKIKNNK